MECAAMLETYENLKKILASVEDDVKKAAGGNKAAGTRVRKVMQELKAAAQALREQVLLGRSAGDAGEVGGEAE
jgi:hypothetical protein